MSAGILDSDASLVAFIQAFLDGLFPVADFHHREHVVMAGWHLLRSPVDEALDQVRIAVSRYLAAQGIQNTDSSGYHETLTVFWMRCSDRRVFGGKWSEDDWRRLRLLDESGRPTLRWNPWADFHVS